MMVVGGTTWEASLYGLDRLLVHLDLRQGKKLKVRKVYSLSLLMAQVLRACWPLLAWRLYLWLSSMTCWTELH